MLPGVLFGLFALEFTLCVTMGLHIFGESFMLRLGELSAYIAMYLLAVRLAFVMASFWAAQQLDRQRPQQSLRQWLRMVGREYFATMLAFSLLIPFSFLLGPRLRRQRASTVVLLVHGLLSNRGVWWWFAHQLRRQGVAVDSLNLAPTFGDMDGYVAQLGKHIARLQACGVQHIVLVGHSMGGLVCRAWLAKHGAGPVSRLITIASPLRGSACANWLPGKNLRQMRPASAWLAMQQHPLAVPAAAIYSMHDNIAVPHALARDEALQMEQWQHLGHLSVLFDARVVERVAQLLRS